MNISFEFYNFFKKKVGQRDTPFVNFYFLPLFSYSRTAVQNFKIHIGWLYFTIVIIYDRFKSKKR
jgi:hypothetical protein